MQLLQRIKWFIIVYIIRLKRRPTSDCRATGKKKTDCDNASLKLLFVTQKEKSRKLTEKKRRKELFHLIIQTRLPAQSFYFLNLELIRCFRIYLFVYICMKYEPAVSKSWGYYAPFLLWLCFLLLSLHLVEDQCLYRKGYCSRLSSKVSIEFIKKKL